MPDGKAAAAVYPDGLRHAVDSYLGELTFEGEADAPGLVEAMRYSLLAGGKRIRPVLSLATAEALGGDPETVLPFAASVEMIHTYSLIHDDLPAMDDDDLRRGMPTLHRRSGDAVAILAGDCLYAEAFRLLLTRQSGEAAAVARAAAVLASAAASGGMVGGQFIDVEGTASAGVDGLARLHALKTGRLISASCEGVAALLDADESQSAAIAGYAGELGVLFQIVDDVLDVTGTDESLGKPSGSDQRQGKRTFVTELGLEGSLDRAAGHHAAALSSLETFGAEAEDLRVIAGYVLKRTS